MCWSVRFCFIVVLHIIALEGHFEILFSVNVHTMNLISFGRARQVYFYSNSKLHTAVFTKQLYYVRCDMFTDVLIEDSGILGCMLCHWVSVFHISKECSVFNFKVWKWSTVLLWRENTNPATYHHIWKEL